MAAAKEEDIDKKKPSVDAKSSDTFSPSKFDTSKRSDFPLELVKLILNRFDWPKAFGLRAVCKSWNSALSYYNPVRPQSPYLLHLSSEGPGNHHLISVTEQASSQFWRPELCGECCGAYGNWLVMKCSSSNHMSVVNILTGDCIKLPPWHAEAHPYVYLSSVPTLPNCVLLARTIVDKAWDFFSCKPEDDEWTKQNFDLENPKGIQAIAASGGKFYMVSSFTLLVIDFSLPVMSISEVDYWQPSFIYDGELLTYLVELGGNMYLVYRLKEQEDSRINHFNIALFCRSSKSLVKIRNLGKYCLFLGELGSIIVDADATGLLRNCIYFTDAGNNLAWRVHRMDIDRSWYIETITNGPNLRSKTSKCCRLKKGGQKESLIWIQPGHAFEVKKDPIFVPFGSLF